MAIDKNAILADVTFWLPTSNVLDTTDLTFILDKYIDLHGTDDDKAPILTYNTLKGAALKNKAMIMAGEGQLKDSRVGQVWSSFHKVELLKEWDLFIKSLVDIAPIFGYTAKSMPIGKIGPGDTIDLFDDEIDDTSTLYRSEYD